jgi:hypothetical protein
MAGLFRRVHPRYRFVISYRQHVYWDTNLFRRRYPFSARLYIL